jgi:uncharacterized protein (TIGR03435 family)
MRLGISSKALLGALAILAASGPLGFGLLRAMQSPAAPYHPDGTALLNSNALSGVPFKSATLTPSKDNGGRPFQLEMTQTGLTSIHTSLQDLIRFAYHAKSYDQIVGGPSWIDTEFYDLNVEWPDSESANAAIDKLPPELQQDEPRLLMKSFLAERFQLKTSVETRDLPVYALVMAGSSPKLKKVELTSLAPGTPPPAGAHIPSLMFSTPTQVTATAMDMHTLADFLSIFDELEGHLAVDETGLKGNYDFLINGVSPSNAKKPIATQIFTALQDQLGLKLELRKATGVEVLLIDHAERPGMH